MRTLSIVLSAALFLSLSACDSEGDYGPTVDQFDGQLVHEGEPVSFAPEEKVKLRVIHKGNAESFGIPIKEDGTFDIGWMPIGEYSAALEREKPAQEGKRGGAPNRYQVPGGLTIEEGKTQYEIELGKDWKP